MNLNPLVHQVPKGKLKKMFLTTLELPLLLYVIKYIIIEIVQCYTFTFRNNIL